MATPAIQQAFVTGEVSPSTFGRVDIDKERVAASTCRNMYVAYRGGASSRAGTAFVGFSKQTGRQYPPRLIPFQFSALQGIALEFGNLYMRAVVDGAFVTESPVAIGAASQTNPVTLTFGTQGAATATPITAGVRFSYAPGDLVTLLGGTALTPAVLQVTTSELVSILPNAPGTGYTVADTVTLAGGTSSVAAIATVATIQSVKASGNIQFANNPADGDTVTLNGVVWTFKTTLSGAAQTLIQASLAGTMVQLAADLNASANASLTVATYGSTVSLITVIYGTAGVGGNAYTLAASVGVRSGPTLTGGTATGIGTLTVSTAGIFSALPVNGAMTQSATTGGGTGASFQTAVFGPHAVSVSNPGAYTTLPVNPVAQDSTTGTGVGATFTMAWASVPAFNNGDWLAISGMQGMTELNGNTYVAQAVTPTTAQLFDVYGNAVDGTGFGAYTGGGTAARIYTLATPYLEQDLKYLKFTESADAMTLCCVNQETDVEYEPQNLTRLADDNWVFSDVVAVPSVDPPATASATISSGSGSAFYQYVVTAVSPIDGSESVPSPIASVKGVSISTQLGQVNVSWAPVTGVDEYNIYKAQPSYGSAIPTGSLYGYAGSAYGTAFSDTNITPDFAQVPPRHQNPFARGQIIGVTPVTGGSKYTTATATITSGSGSSASLEVVLQSGAVVAFIVDDAGEGYEAGDTVAITGDGTGATAVLVIGAETGTFPSVPGYFQQRRVFANTLNNPDTYFMSQPGAFDNFDTRIPTIDSDAIIGSPWAVQVNGIQFLVQVASGLLVMSGSAAWILGGPGSFATNVQAISPSSQVANPQPFTGCSPTVPPVKEDYDVIYVDAAGSFYYDLPYQLYALSEPIDLTLYSTHLFIGYTVREHAWCKKPYKVLWSVRDDGTMLSLTFLKAEQIAGWGRHDTDGLFMSVCSITEPPIDALYMAVQRFPGDKTAYMIERMNDRIWAGVEDSWCVDCGLALPQPTPNATLVADSTYGLGAITGVTSLVGGEGYSAATTGTVVDDNGKGPGTGAVPILTIVAGVITAITFPLGQQGSGYINPSLVITDPSNGGADASADLVLDTTATFTADGAIFTADNIGDVIRMGNGIATITAYIDPEHVRAWLSTPITKVRPNSNGQIIPQKAGNWTLTTPVQTISGLGYLAGMTVTGLADGNVVTPRVVAANGTITLDAPASQVTIGIGYQAQLQSVYLDAGSPTVQGSRKKIAEVDVLFEASRGVEMGSNQIDGSTLVPSETAPEWTDLQEMPDLVAPAYNSNVVPLYTGYNRAPASGGWQKNGQVAIQQSLPLPVTVLAIVPRYLEGDVPEQEAKPRQRGHQ